MVTFCSKVISKASLLSHSDSAAPSVPIWLCTAGPGPSAPVAGGLEVEGGGRWGMPWGTPWAGGGLPPAPASAPQRASLNFLPQSGLASSPGWVIL